MCCTEQHREHKVTEDRVNDADHSWVFVFSSYRFLFSQSVSWEQQLHLTSVYDTINKCQIPRLLLRRWQNEGSKMSNMKWSDNLWRRRRSYCVGFNIFALIALLITSKVIMNYVPPPHSYEWHVKLNISLALVCFHALLWRIFLDSVSRHCLMHFYERNLSQN